jgi:hypothetical protein
MAREPQRREQPRHLDAAIVPLERALTARAKAIEAQVDVLAEDLDNTVILAGALTAVATEFRALAEELRYW